MLDSIIGNKNVFKKKKRKKNTVFAPNYFWEDA